MRKDATPRTPVAHARVSELRALAHPLRLRILELFAEAPRTTMQVAAVLRQPPTRLYHHVNALERAGLLRVKETRANRGTVERWYEAVGHGYAAGASDGSASARGARAALASAALDQSRAEVATAMSRGRGEKPLVMRIGVVASPARIRAVRKRLMKLLDELKGDAKPNRAIRAPKNSQRWTVTITMAPALGRNTP